MNKILFLVLFLPAIGFSQIRGLNNTTNPDMLLLMGGNNKDTVGLKLRSLISIGNTADKIPVGTTAQEPIGELGFIRLNRTTSKFRGVRVGSAWEDFFTLQDGLSASSGQALTWNGSVWGPTTLSTGNITGAGVIGGIPYFTSSTNIGSSSSFQYDLTNKTLEFDTPSRIFFKTPQSGTGFFFFKSNDNSRYWEMFGSDSADNLVVCSQNNGLKILSSNINFQPTVNFLTDGENQINFGKIGSGTYPSVTAPSVIVGRQRTQTSGVFSQVIQNYFGSDNYEYYAPNGNAGMVMYGNVAGNLFSLRGSNVGINNFSPSEALDVTGNVKFSGALMPNNTAGSPGQVLTSAGPGASPVWSTPSATNAGVADQVGVFTNTTTIGSSANFTFTTAGGLYAARSAAGVRTALTLENADATDGNSSALDFKNNGVVTGRVISSNPNPGVGGLSLQVRDASAAASQNYLELTDEDQIKLNRAMVIGSESLSSGAVQITGDLSIAALESGATSATLPEIVGAPVAANQVEVGTMLTVPNNTTVDIIVTRGGAADLLTSSGTGVSSLLLKAGQTLFVTATGLNNWSYSITGSDASEKFTDINLSGASTGTVNLTNANVDNLIRGGAVTVTSLTVVLPTSPIDGQVCKISTGGGMSVTTLTITGPVASVNPTTWPAGSSVEYKYYTNQSQWVIKSRN